MSTTYFLDPDGDDKAGWTEVPAGSAFDRLNDAVRQPTAPSTASDWIEDAATDTCRVNFTTTTLAAGETVVCARLWYYCATPAGRQIDVAFRVSATATMAQENTPTGFTGWRSLEVAAPLTQAQVNSLQAQFVAKSGSGTVTVYAAYIELITRTDIWDVPNAKFRFNRHADTGLSIGAGYMGSDVGPSVDLGSGRSLAYGGDPGFATAAGQQFWFGTNAANPSAARAAFVRNHALLIDAYDLDTANFTFLVRASNTPYHPDDATVGSGRWPFKSFIQGGRLFTVGRFSSVSGVWVAYTDDWSSNPSTPLVWTWTYLPPIPAFVLDRPNCEWGIWDDGAGKVYCWSAGPARFSATANTVSVCRLDTTSFHAAAWRRAEWWTGQGWVFDKQGTVLQMPPQHVGRQRLRKCPYPPQARALSGQGAVLRRASDSKFQLVAIDETALSVTSPPWALKYALTAGTSPNAGFGSMVSKFVVPEGEPFVYGPACHPQLTWSGKGTNDQVWSYASNWTDSISQWSPLYHSRWVKATGVT